MSSSVLKRHVNIAGNILLEYCTLGVKWNGYIWYVYSKQAYINVFGLFTNHLTYLRKNGHALICLVSALLMAKLLFIMYVSRNVHLITRSRFYLRKVEMETSGF